MPTHRLQKIISEAGICSRRKAELLIRQDRVKVNRQLARIGDKANPEKDSIFIDEKPIRTKPSKRVFLVNKPVGFISSCKDPFGRKTVISLLPKGLRSGIYPIGRLDKDSRGAILLTNNGELTLQLTHPKYSHSKTYLSLVEGIPSQYILEQWNQGVILNGRKTRQAEVKIIKEFKSRSLIKIIMREGQNRQIRRIASKMGHPVVDLQRIAIAHLELKDLPEGSWRELEKEEWMPIIKRSQSL